LFSVLSNLSLKSSQILATWLLSDNPKKLSMHKFFEKDPSKLLLRFGFAEVDVSSIGSMGKIYNRNPSYEVSSSYLLSCHQKL